VSLLAQDERLTRRVGAVVLLLVAAAIAFMVFLYDRIEWRSHVRIGVYFRHAGGLHEGAPIVVAGRAIGEIESIARSPHGAPNTPLDGEEGIVATVAIEERIAKQITSGGDIFVTSKGTIGARYLEIGPAPDPSAKSLAEDPHPVLGNDPPSMDRVLQRTWDNLTITREFADAVRPEMDELRARLRDLSKTLDELSPNIVGVASLGVEVSALADEARTLRDVGLGGDAGREKITNVIGEARATVAHAKRVFDELGARAHALSSNATALRARLGERGPEMVHNVELAIDRMRAAIDKIDPLLAKVDEINARIARGEGSLGKLMKDPEFPEDAKALGKIMKRQPWKVMQRPDK
jgi:phospholipid/cholesterol/gamma-HCH transport system substrate-binding protein